LTVGLESTNTYAEALAYWLHAEGHRVYLLIPSGPPVTLVVEANAIKPIQSMR